MQTADVLITGMGVVSAAGMDVDSSMESMFNGRRNLSPLSLFDSPLKFPVYEVDHPALLIKTDEMRTLQLLHIAVEEALSNAQLEYSENIGTKRVGVCFGTSVACQLNDLEFYQTFRAQNEAPLRAVDKWLNGNLAEAVAKKIGSNGPAVQIVNACSSGTDAIGVALEWLRADICDVVIAGGADELSRIPVCGFNALGIVSDEPCAPFDAARKGLNLGEGAGVLIMERRDSAFARGVKSNLKVCGYGTCADAYHLTAPHPEGDGLRRAVSMALHEAKIDPTQISFVNAHGTSTRDNDLVEGRLLKDVFGNSIKVHSTKGYTGHTLGAAGGIEAVFAATCLQRGSIPPSAGFKNFDSEIGLAPVSEVTSINGRYALSTSLAFGGNNSALIIALEENQNV